MLLCDIGNTSFDFLRDSVSYKERVRDFNPASIKERVFYICVNAAVAEKIKRLDNWIDVAAFIDMKKYYPTMGIDRIFAVEAVESGVIIDAGSAITVDVVKNGIFEGGFIYPGIAAMRRSYKEISPALDYAFNFEINLEKLPKNSVDAISYGYLKTLYSEVISYNLEIILTGGDAKFLSSIFKDAKIDDRVIFHGMKRVLSERHFAL